MLVEMLQGGCGLEPCGNGAHNHLGCVTLDLALIGDGLAENVLSRSLLSVTSVGHRQTFGMYVLAYPQAESLAPRCFQQPLAEFERLCSVFVSASGCL